MADDRKMDLVTRLLADLDAAIGGICERRMAAMWTRDRTVANRLVAEWRAQREGAHGPCPPRVWVPVLNHLVDRMAAVRRWPSHAPRMLDDVTLMPHIPRPGTLARRAYDRWMRR